MSPESRLLQGGAPVRDSTAVGAGFVLTLIALSRSRERVRRFVGLWASCWQPGLQGCHPASSVRLVAFWHTPLLCRVGLVRSSGGRLPS